MLIILLAIILISLSGFDALHRYNGFLNPIQVIIDRGIWWKVEWIDGFFFMFSGSGLSTGHVDDNGYFSYGMSMDNMYLYNLITLGVFGSLLFYTAMFFLIKQYDKGCIQKRIQMSLFFSYMFMGLGGEVFQLSLTGLSFWIFSGFLLGSSKIQHFRLTGDK